MQLSNKLFRHATYALRTTAARLPAPGWPGPTPDAPEPEAPLLPVDARLAVSEDTPEDVWEDVATPWGTTGMVMASTVEEVEAPSASSADSGPAPPRFAAAGSTWLAAWPPHQAPSHRNFTTHTAVAAHVGSGAPPRVPDYGGSAGIPGGPPPSPAPEPSPGAFEQGEEGTDVDVVLHEIARQRQAKASAANDTGHGEASPSPHRVAVIEDEEGAQLYDPSDFREDEGLAGTVHPYVIAPVPGIARAVGGGCAPCIDPERMDASVVTPTPVGLGGVAGSGKGGAASLKDDSASCSEHPVDPTGAYVRRHMGGETASSGLPEPAGGEGKSEEDPVSTSAPSS